MKLSYSPLLILLFLAACATGPAPVAPPPAIANDTEDRATPAKPEPRVLPFPEDSFYDLLVAEFAVRQQQYDVALGHYLYQAEVTRDAGVAATAARLAQFLNAHKSALTAAELWLEIEPDDHEARFIAASALAKSHRPLDALPHMAAVLKHGGNTNFAALAASALGQPEPVQRQFLAELTALLGEYPQELSLKIARALMLQYRDEETEALILVREVLLSEPENIHALLIETQLLRQLDRDEEALLRLQFAVDAHPDNKRLRLQLAEQLVKTDIEAAREQFELLGQRYPHDADLIISRALIEQESGDLIAARELLTPLLGSRDHVARAHFLLGRIAERLGDRTVAAAHYRNISDGPEFLRAITRLTAITHQDDGLDTARRQLRQLRQQRPDLAVRLYLLESELLFDDSAFDAGHELLTTALAEHPDDPGILYSRSLFSERIGNVALLEQDLRQLLAMEPDNAAALNALGYSLANLTDRLEEAKQLVQRALVFRPNDAAIQDSLGWILYRQGDLENARKLLAGAFDKINDHEIAAHYGEVLWELGDFEKARAVWKQGLEDEPDSPIIAETMRRLGADTE